ncbi:MAG: vWA domain-containing protein [bacterium]|nr:vWA domain-containing protein [bacterium]
MTKFKKLNNIIMVIAIVVSYFFPSIAFALEKGDVINPENSVGTLTNAGDVKLEKTVEKTDEEGVYKITLNVSGKNTITTTSQTEDIYAVVVFDRSGSMDDENKNNVDKYGSAKEGAINFASQLHKLYPLAQIGLVTFSTSVKVTRDLEASDFSDVTFPKADGDTYIGAAIKKATGLLSDKDGKRYMIVLSDGSPNEGDNNNRYKKESEKAKEAGIEIFTIGYEVNEKAEKVLKYIATDDDHYFSASVDNIVTMFSNIVENIKVEIPAGKNSIIKDVIADEFTYVEGSASPEYESELSSDGKQITFYTGEITEEAKEVSFKVRIDPDSPTGLYRTNDFASVTYDDSDDEENTDTILDSSEVYWEQKKYDYTINYFKEGESVPFKTSTGSDILNAIIPVQYDEQRPTGYRLITEKVEHKISQGENIINVYYAKKNDLIYLVEYFKDDLTNKLGSTTFENQLFGSIIKEEDISKDLYRPDFYKNGVIVTTMPYIIGEGQNIIQVLYSKRNDLTYTVKYIDKDTEEELFDSVKRENKTYLETYTEEAMDAPFGYVLDDEQAKDIILTSDEMVLVFNYSKRNDFSYTVKYLEKDTEKELEKTKEVTNVTYDSKVVEDAIEIKGYNLVGDETQELVINEEDLTITFYYEKKNNLKYRVEYYLDGEIDSTLTKEYINMIFGDEVSLNEEDIIELEGYKYIKNSGSIIIDDEKDNVIKVFYEKIKEEKAPVTGINYKTSSFDLIMIIYLALAIVFRNIMKKIND